jgi:GMP synthase PP-ATPase subunit
VSKKDTPIPAPLSESTTLPQDAERRDKSLYGEAYLKNPLLCRASDYPVVGEVKHQEDINWKVSTDKTSEAFTIVEDFINKVCTQGDSGEVELLLDLRLVKTSAAFNAAVYEALTELLKMGTQGTKARWSLRVR